MNTSPSKLLTHFRDRSAERSSFVQGGRKWLRDNILSILVRMKSRQPWDAQFLCPIYCHNVFDDQIESFACIITALKEVGTFISTGACVEMIEGLRPVDRRYFHLSFDDGHLNNFTNALPILEREQVPAIFFVCSDHVGIDMATEPERKSTWKPGTDRIPLASADVLKEARQRGFEIGSHTVSHARLSDISNSTELLQTEIQGSRKSLSALIGSSCDYIAWPYGKLEDVDRTSLQAVRDAGFRACFGAYRGRVSPGVTNRFSIPRHQFECHWDLSHIFYFLKGNHERKLPHSLRLS